MYDKAFDTWYSVYYITLLKVRYRKTDKPIPNSIPGYSDYGKVVNTWANVISLVT